MDRVKCNSTVKWLGLCDVQRTLEREAKRVLSSTLLSKYHSGVLVHDKYRELIEGRSRSKAKERK